MKIITCFLFIACLPIAAQTDLFIHSLFNSLLNEAVSSNGEVDYLYFKGNESFEDYLQKIADANISEFKKNEKLAFYINTYNAFVIKNVLDHWPIKSPMDIEGFFKKYKFKAAGEMLSLDEIEYERTLKIEPVLPHFGLVCAAKSCPKLLPLAYKAGNVLEQLKENMKFYLNDASRNYLDKKKKTLYLSRLFSWFKETFEKEYGSLTDFAVQYVDNQDADFIRSNEIEISFLKYNWELNSQ
jgi:hypothetical protein